MSIFRTYTFSWKQVAVLKIAVAAIALAAGAYWSSFFSQYLLGLLALGIVCGAYLAFVMFGK